MAPWMRRLLSSYELKISGGWLTHIALAIPRISAMLILAIAYGPKKFGVPWSPSEKELSFFEVSPGFVDYIADSELIFSSVPLLFAWLAGFSEVIAALFVALGFKTRFFASFVLITMLTAFYTHIDDPIKESLSSLCFAWIALYSLALGSGRLGLDHWINRWLKK